MTYEVSEIYLYDKTKKGLVVGELWDTITARQVEDWAQKWVPAQKASEESYAQAKADFPLLRESNHWDWGKKVDVTKDLLAISGFSVMCSGVTQGLMLLDTIRSCKLSQQSGKPLVYIEFLETAPWNRPGSVSSEAQLRNVGSILVRAAIELSLQEDFKGRIGLHSLPQSNTWYEKFCGMTDLGADAQKQSLHYFEMSPEQALAFIDKGNTS